MMSNVYWDKLSLLMLGSVKKVAGLLEVANKYSTFLFDLDGVVVPAVQLLSGQVTK